MIPRWLEVAQAEIGVHETPGPKATPRIREYLAVTPLAEGGNSDETPWCSSFVNWCFRQCRIKGTGSAAARSWVTWGETRERRPGCVVVLKARKRNGERSTTPSGYHVGFYVAGNARTIRLLGGNQSDSVCEVDFPLARWDVVAVRWPVEER